MNERNQKVSIGLDTAVVLRERFEPSPPEGKVRTSPIHGEPSLAASGSGSDRCASGSPVWTVSGCVW